MWDDWTATEQSNAAADAEDRRRWDRAAGPPTIAPQALERPDTPAAAPEPQNAALEPIVVRPGPSLTPERRRLGLQALRKLLR